MQWKEILREHETEPPYTSLCKPAEGTLCKEQTGLQIDISTGSFCGHLRHLLY